MKGQTLTLEEILKLAMKKGASDVHLKAGIIPVVRRHGKLRPLSSELPPLSEKQIKDMAFAIMEEQQREHFEKHKDLDMGFGISGLGRFRVNIFQQRGTIRMVIRNIPHVVPTIKELSLPPTFEKIASYERGLVLVTGATGSGKSSTLAAIVDHINRNKNKHILMIEDPTEYLIRDRKSLITQRELGVDTLTFSSSLKAALRQDPDVILIGEMRDKETIEIALLAAETGHLVLSTLHTLDAQETINRVVASFEPHQQPQIRMQLASVLKAVISQRLARRKDKTGFVPAVEILVNNTRVKEMIEDPSKTGNIRVAIEEGGNTYGMQTFDQALMNLVGDKVIDYDEAIRNSTSPEDFAVRYAGVDQMGKDWNNNSGIQSHVADKWRKLTQLEIEKPISDDSEEKTRVETKKPSFNPLKKNKKAK